MINSNRYFLEKLENIVLPSPPKDSEKSLYLKQNKYFLYIFGYLSVLSLCYGGWLFSNNSSYTRLILLFFTISLIWATISYVIGFVTPGFNIDKHSLLKRKAFILFEKYGYPNIDIYLPTCGEDISVIANTQRYVKKILWKGDLKIYALDDADREDVKVLSGLNNINYICRSDIGVLKKAGNLRNAFKQTKGEYFLILDADFCPREDILYEMMPYFLLKDVGIVQSPQYFRVLAEQSFIEKGAGYIQELFYRIIQTSRDYFKGAICVGTSAIYKRSVLESFGGTAAVGHSEDMRTGLQINIKGYYVKYIPLILSCGICPDNVRSFYNQQYRWSAGSGSLMFKSEFWVVKMSFMQRLSYISGMLYYTVMSLNILFNSLPALIMTWFFPNQILITNFIIVLPSILIGYIFMPLWSNFRWGFYTPAVMQIASWAYARALLDSLTGSMMQWIPSGNSSKGSSQYKSFKFWYPLITTLQSILIMVGSFRFSESFLDIRFIPNFVVALLNLFLMGWIVSKYND